MSNFLFTPKDTARILNMVLKEEPTYQEGMEIESITILDNGLLHISAKNSLDPVFAATYQKVVREWLPTYNF